VPTNRFALQWLFRQGAVLLWAETLLMTEGDFGSIHMLRYFSTDREKEAVRRLFDHLAAEGIDSTYNPDRYLPAETLQSIQSQVEDDEARFGPLCPPTDAPGDRDLCNMAIGEGRYCQPMVRGIYGSLTIARFLGAACLFDEAEYRFCKDRFAHLLDPGDSQTSPVEVFSNVYNVFIPALDVINDFRLFCPPEERACTHRAECLADTHLHVAELENTILTLRARPELRKLASYIDMLHTELGSNERALWAAIRKDVARQQLALFAAAPQVRTFTTFLEKASGLIALFAVAKGDGLLALGAGALAGVAATAGVGMEALLTRRAWLATLVKNVDPKKLGPRQGGE
jgi:hypothetical protein